jgi:hypothetical protein
MRISFNPRILDRERDRRAGHRREKTMKHKQFTSALLFATIFGFFLLAHSPCYAHATWNTCNNACGDNTTLAATAACIQSHPASCDGCWVTRGFPPVAYSIEVWPTNYSETNNLKPPKNINLVGPRS